MRTWVILSGLLLTVPGCPASGPGTVGVGFGCESEALDTNCVCGDHQVVAGQAFTVFANNNCACEGSEPAGCDVAEDNGTFTLTVRADTCAVGDCSLPSCSVIAVACEIPAQDPGTITIRECGEAGCESIEIDVVESGQTPDESPACNLERDFPVEGANSTC